MIVPGITNRVAPAAARLASQGAAAGRVYFREEQRVNMPTVYIVLLVVIAGVFALLVAIPPGMDDIRNPMVRPIMALAAASITTLLGALMAFCSLTTEVCGDGLFVRMNLVRKPVFIPLEGVTRCTIVSPSLRHRVVSLQNDRPNPLMRTPQTRVFVLSTRSAVRLDYADGHFVMIGTDRPESLRRAITSLLEAAGR